MGPDNRERRIPSHSDHSLELAVRIEQVIGAVPHVRYDHPPVLQCHDIDRAAKLPRAFTLPSDFADQRAVGTHDEDPVGLAVEHVQPPGTIERHPAHIAELLPLLAP